MWIQDKGDVERSGGWCFCEEKYFQKRNIDLKQVKEATQGSRESSVYEVGVQYNSAGKIKTTFYYSWISKLEESIIPPKGHNIKLQTGGTKCCHNKR